MLLVESDGNKENEPMAENVEGVSEDKKLGSANESSEDELVVRKKKTVLEDSSEEEGNDLEIVDDAPSQTPLEADPESFLATKIKSPHISSDSGSSGRNNDSEEMNDDSEGSINEKRKRKKKMKKKKIKGKSKGDLNKSELTDDEDDHLLKDIETLLDKPDEAMNDCGADIKGRESDSDGGSSVGLPDDMYVTRKPNETDSSSANKQKKKKNKQEQDFDIEQWQNEEWTSTENKDRDGKKKKSKDKTKTLDPVCELVSARQKMMREREIKLPRHDPEPLKLRDCLARIPKLTSVSTEEHSKPVFVPKLSSKTDEFFLPKDLGNFMGRFKKHLSLSSKVVTDKPTTQKCAVVNSKQNVPQSVFTKRNIQQELKDKILAKKIETRKAAELERQVDEEEFQNPEQAQYDELQKLLENDEEMSDSEEEGEQQEAEEIAEEQEDVDEKTDRRAEKILLGEEISSSSEEEEKEERGVEERKYHTDTDSDLLASADEVHVNELPPDSASEDDALQPSRYSLRKLTRYIRKKRITKSRRDEQLEKRKEGKKEKDSHSGSEDENQKSLEKIEKAKKKIEMLLEKRKEMKLKRKAMKEKKAKQEAEKERMNEIRRKAEEEAIKSEERRRELASQDKIKSAQKPAVHKPWLSESEDELPCFNTELSPTPAAKKDKNSHSKRNWMDDSFLETRAARVLAGEPLSSSSEDSQPERKYHSDTDSDLLASADEVHVNELPPDSASEDDALQPSRYSLRKLTRYCRKKRINRERRREQRIAIGSESEKEEKAKKKLQDLLKRREEIKRRIYQKKSRGKREISSTQDLFGGSLSLTGICRTNDSQSSSLHHDGVLITSTIVPDSMDTLPVSEKTFDVDTAVKNVVEDSQFIQKSQGFLPPDEDAVFLDTQGMLRSRLDTSGEGGIDGLASDSAENSVDMLNLCSGRFGGSAPNSGEFGGTQTQGFSQTEGRVTVQDISFNLNPSPDLDSLSQTPNAPKTPSSKNSKLGKPLSQTPLTRYGGLAGVLSQDSDDDEEETEQKEEKKSKKKRRALQYSEMFDNEAEKSGSDHSEDELEGDIDEYDTSLMAKDSELPSDEEELAEQLKQAYHNQQALDEKEQLKRLKERFVQEEQGFFRTRKFHGEDSNIDLFSTNLGLDFEDEDVETSAEAYKEAMKKRAERLKKEQFVKEKRLKEGSAIDRVDEDSQAFLDSLQDITDSNSRSTFSNSQQCGSFLKHGPSTLSRLSSVTNNSINSEKTSNRAYVFQTVSPAQNKRKSSAKFASDPKRPKKFSNTGVNSDTDKSNDKSIFNVIK